MGDKVFPCHALVTAIHTLIAMHTCTVVHVSMWESCKISVKY